MARAEFLPNRIIEALARNEVDFILIGGLAATLHGSAMMTGDADIVYERSPANLDRLGVALIEMEATLRGIDEDLPFTPDARTLKNGWNFTFVTKFGSLDCLSWPDGMTSYEQLSSNAVEVELDGYWIPIASIDDLIEMKSAAGRGKDIEGIEHLKVAKELSRRVRPSESSD